MQHFNHLYATPYKLQMDPNPVRNGSVLDGLQKKDTNTDKDKDKTDKTQRQREKQHRQRHSGQER